MRKDAQGRARMASGKQLVGEERARFCPGGARTLHFVAGSDLLLVLLVLLLPLAIRTKAPLLAMTFRLMGLYRALKAS